MKSILGKPLKTGIYTLTISYTDSNSKAYTDSISVTVSEDSMADKDVIEIGIALGNVEPDIKEAVEQYPVIPSGSIIDNETAFKFCYNFFEDLIKEFESTKDIVPGDVYSKFEEYIYWLRLTAEYKIKHRLYNNVEK